MRKDPKHRNLSFCAQAVTLAACLILATTSAHAQTIPGSADADRAVTVPTRPFKIQPAPLPPEDEAKTNIRYSEPPPNADQITLDLLNITVTGSTVYSDEEIRKIFKNDVGKRISLLRLWEISDEITKKYRQDGYFLSRAFIPAQEISDGKVTIKVAEGYIKKVEIDPALLQYSVVRDIIKRITSERPISSKKLESYHLLLSDFSGLQNLYGTLAQIEGQKDGGVRLIYARNKIPTSTGFVGINNYGSKFLGPTQASAEWQGNVAGLQETSIALRTSMPANELVAGNASQSIPLSPFTSLIISAGMTHAEPGFTLSAQEIESRSLDIGLKLNHKIIRQRTENWSASIGLDGRNSNSTILGTTELSEDKVRALRIGTIYDTYDRLGAFNRIEAIGSHGLEFLGSSDEHDINISRDGAEPGFTKVEINYIRYQPLPWSLSALLNLKGQKASGSLYSSEEFGFGSREMGRAYDSSEITGDDGIGASLEIQYNDITPVFRTSIEPYLFYDIGKVWNKNTGQVDAISASSTGLGLRLDHENGLTGSVELALPLTKTIDNPIYGDDETSPRIGLQVGYKF